MMEERLREPDETRSYLGARPCGGAGAQTLLGDGLIKVARHRQSCYSFGVFQQQCKVQMVVKARRESGDAVVHATCRAKLCCPAVLTLLSLPHGHGIKPFEAPLLLPSTSGSSRPGRKFLEQQPGKALHGVPRVECVN